MPAIITPLLLEAMPDGSRARSVASSVLNWLLTDPIFSGLNKWNLVALGARISYPNLQQLSLIPSLGAVVNLCIDINILPLIQSQPYSLQLGTDQVDPWMVWFIKGFLIPYWLGSPSSQVVDFDPRTISVESVLVPDARRIGDAITYVFSDQTPLSGSSSKTIDRTYNKNLTSTGNSTQVATLKMANSTSHLETNITKRAPTTCQDLYPNVQLFLEAAPMTYVGTNTISCAA